jgi:CelD/BcsL family acetyltransferase involved in cellulose biosynthesis
VPNTEYISQRRTPEEAPSVQDTSERPAAEQADFQCRIVTRFNELQQLCSDWRTLHSGLSRPEIFLHLDWVSEWWRSFGGGYELSVPVLSRDGQVVAILPLVRQERRLMYLGHSVADYCDLLHNGADSSRVLEVVLDSVLNRTRPWDVIEINNVPETSRLAAAIENLSGHWRSRVEKSPGDPCPTLAFGADKQQALASVLGKDKLRKAVRYLARRGELRFHHIEDEAEFESHFEEFMRQHIRRSAIAGRRSAFLNDDYVSFYRGLVKVFGLRSEIRFSVLEVGDRPVAYHFGTLFASKYLFYKPTFDVDYWDLSPGQVLLWYLLDYCRMADVNEFDFGQGGESYKFRFANDVRHNVNYKIYAPRLHSRARRLCDSMVQKAKRRFRNSPVLIARLDISKQAIRHVLLAFRRAGALGIARTIFDRVPALRETRSLLRAVISVTRADPSKHYRIEQATLATLSDQAVKAPEFLTGELLQDARKRLARKEKVWILSTGESARAVLWISDTPSGPSASPEEASLFISDVWPLVPKFGARDFIPMIDAVREEIQNRFSSLQMRCPDSFLPPSRILSAAGITRMQDPSLHDPTST